MQSKGRDFAEYFCFTQKRRLSGGILKESDKNNCNLRRFSGRICSFQGAGGVYGGLGKKGFRFRRLVSRAGVEAESFRIGPGPARSNLSVQKPGSAPRGGRYPPCSGGHTPPQSALAYALTGPPEELIQAGLRQMFFSGCITPGWVPPARRVGNAYAVIHDRVMGVGGYEKGLSPIGQNEGVCCKKMQQNGEM